MIYNFYTNEKRSRFVVCKIRDLEQQQKIIPIRDADKNQMNTKVHRKVRYILYKLFLLYKRFFAINYISYIIISVRFCNILKMSKNHWPQVYVSQNLQGVLESRTYNGSQNEFNTT